MFSSPRNLASLFAGFLILQIITSLIGANIRTVAAKRGWDTVLDKGIAELMAVPIVGRVITYTRDMIGGWVPLRRRWWLWLFLGLSLGVAASLWTISLLPPEGVTPPLVKADILRLLGELPALDEFMDQGQPLNRELAELLQRQPRLITLSLPVVDTKSQASALQQKFSALRKDFYDFLGSHSYDRDELYKLID